MAELVFPSMARSARRSSANRFASTISGVISFPQSFRVWPPLTHALFLTCESIPSLGPDPELMNFYGGFDPREFMDNTMKEAGFLTFLYPASNAENLKRTIGMIDLPVTSGTEA